MANVFGQFNAATAPLLIVNNGVVTNADPTGSNTVNNALGYLSLTGGTLTSTTGNSSGYAAWNLNGPVSSSGQSYISTTAAPGSGQVMLGKRGHFVNNHFQRERRNAHRLGAVGAR